ncbi:helix-turn-helix domain-containing protein [Phocaeicola plebeius]|uniref:helix-turn-helix domain-containing protein n=1 Tax=Phocaeicola plebeius TaxID=310297 RepID=UPI00307C1541
MEKISQQLDEIKVLILLSAKNVLTIDEVALLTDLSVSCLYKKTCSRQIPFYRSGKRIYFNRKEIEDWMMKCHTVANSGTEQDMLSDNPVDKLNKGDER